MSFCPNCRSEYQEGFARCPDCDVDLVAQLDVEPETGSEAPVNLVELASFSSAVEAEMFEEVLENEGITGVLHGDFLPIAGEGGPEVTLLVDQADLGKASALLENCFPDDPEAVSPEDEEQAPGQR